MNQGRIPTDKEPLRRDVEGDTSSGMTDVDQGMPNAADASPPSPEITMSSDEQDAAVPAQEIQKDMAALQKELAAASDRHLRLAAEFDNYRRRVERERADVYARAQSDIAKLLLDPIDDLERVAHHAAGEVNYQALLEGVQLVEKKMRSSLANAGLEIIDAEGAVFDPNTMEAVAMVEADSEAEDDIVSDVFQRGYRFKGTLLRPARVRVKKHG